MNELIQQLVDILGDIRDKYVLGKPTLRTKKDVLVTVMDRIFERSVLDEVDVEYFTRRQKLFKDNTPDAVENNNNLAQRQKQFRDDKLLLGVIKDSLAKLEKDERKKGKN